MRLYLLRDLGRGGYDTYDSFVVRAGSKEQARQLAQLKDHDGPWSCEQNSTCVYLRESGEASVIIGSFNAG